MSGHTWPHILECDDTLCHAFGWEAILSTASVSTSSVLENYEKKFYYFIICLFRDF